MADVTGRAADDVRAAIEQAGGAIPFSTVSSSWCSTGRTASTPIPTPPAPPDGAATSSPGPRSARCSATVVARFLDAEWERIGRPDPFTVVDAGAGPGTLARSVLAAAPSCASALRYVAVEVSAAQRARHPDGVESVARCPGEPFAGVVLANELLDNLPFRLAVHDGAWREVYVVAGRDGAFAEVLSAPFDPVPAVLPVTAGPRRPGPAARRGGGVGGEARRLVTAGSVLVVDYARPSTAALARRLEWRDVAADVPRPPARRPPAGRSAASRTSPSTSPSTSCRSRMPRGHRRQFLPAGASTSSSRMGGGRGTGRPRRPISPRCGCAAASREAAALLDPSGLGGFAVAAVDCPDRLSVAR